MRFKKSHLFQSNENSIKEYKVSNSSIVMYKDLKLYTAARFEPTIFFSYAMSNLARVTRWVSEKIPWKKVAQNVEYNFQKHCSKYTKYVKDEILPIWSSAKHFYSPAFSHFRFRLSFVARNLLMVSRAETKASSTG
jgi:hypothetical protein